jgi:hypothetical protein
MGVQGGGDGMISAVISELKDRELDRPVSKTGVLKAKINANRPGRLYQPVAAGQSPRRRQAVAVGHGSKPKPPCLFGIGFRDRTAINANAAATAIWANILRLTLNR